MSEPNIGGGCSDCGIQYGEHAVTCKTRWEVRDEVATDIAERIVLGLLEFGDLTPEAYKNKDHIQLYLEDMIRDQLFIWERSGKFCVERKLT